MDQIRLTRFDPLPEWIGPKWVRYACLPTLARAMWSLRRAVGHRLFGDAYWSMVTLAETYGHMT